MLSMKLRDVPAPASQMLELKDMNKHTWQGKYFFFLGNTSARTCGVHCESQHFGGRGGGITEFVARLVYILSTRAVRAM